MLLKKLKSTDKNNMKTIKYKNEDGETHIGFLLASGDDADLILLPITNDDDDSDCLVLGTKKDEYYVDAKTNWTNIDRSETFALIDSCKLLEKSKFDLTEYNQYLKLKKKYE